MLLKLHREDYFFNFLLVLRYKTMLPFPWDIPINVKLKAILNICISFLDLSIYSSVFLDFFESQKLKWKTEADDIYISNWSTQI